MMCLSEDGGPVTCAKGLVIGAHAALMRRYPWWPSSIQVAGDPR